MIILGLGGAKDSADVESGAAAEALSRHDPTRLAKEALPRGAPQAHISVFLSF